MLTLNRLELPVIETPAVTPTKPRRKVTKPKTAPASKHTPANSSVKPWATFGVAFTLVLSAALNGYANVQHAPLAFAGWLMGLAVPVLVLVLAKVTGEKYRAGAEARGVVRRRERDRSLVFVRVALLGSHRDLDWFAGGSGATAGGGNRLWSRGVRTLAHHRSTLTHIPARPA